MPCALEINSNNGFKRGHVETFPSANKNVFPLSNDYGEQTWHSGSLP